MGLLSLENRRLQGGYKKAGEGLLTRPCSHNIYSCDRFKMKWSRVRLDITREFFPVVVVRHGTDCPEKL